MTLDTIYICIQMGKIATKKRGKKIKFITNYGITKFNERIRNEFNIFIR